MSSGPCEDPTDIYILTRTFSSSSSSSAYASPARGLLVGVTITIHPSSGCELIINSNRNWIFHVPKLVYYIFIQTVLKGLILKKTHPTASLHVSHTTTTRRRRRSGRTASKYLIRCNSVTLIGIMQIKRSRSTLSIDFLLHSLPVDPLSRKFHCPVHKIQAQIH